MWSGPRNLSTAMMRSFGARNDCRAMDEPFYAAYLSATGLKHPLYQEIIEDGLTNPDDVVAHCLGVSDTPISYQKHMCHHMIEGFPLDWLDQVTNVSLLREPARVLASYAAKVETVSALDIGFPQQRALMDRVLDGGGTPIVVEASDIRRNPRKMLDALCDAIGIPFDPAMLSWEAGEREEDGVWAKHWYDTVWKSTGFAPAETSPLPTLPEHLSAIEAEVMPDYEFMRSHCLSV